MLYGHETLWYGDIVIVQSASWERTMQEAHAVSLQKELKVHTECSFLASF